MKLLLKVLAVVVAGAVVLALGMFLLGLLATAVKLAFWIAVIGALGWGAVKMLSLMESAPLKEQPAKTTEAKTEESKTISAPEKKSLSDADALRMFEDARRKNTNSEGSK